MAAYPYPIHDIALLYVEDEPESRAMLSRMIAANYPDLSIQVAENGEAGLALFREKRHQIVLTDINMPVMNGIQMAREMSALEPDVVVVAVTAHSDTSYLLSAIEIGIHHYVLKPINYTELFGVIDAILEKITLRRRVREQEAELRASERRFFSIFQATPDLLSITGAADGGYLEVNQAFLRELGYQRSEVVGRPERDLGVWARDKERAGVARALEDLGELDDLEVHFRARSGRELTGLLSAQYLEIDGRRCVLTLFKDISERKRIEEELVRLASIVESSEDAIMATDSDGIITTWNQGAEKIFGLRAQEIKGKHLSTLAPADRREYLARICQGREEQAAHLDLIYPRPDGSQIHVSLNLSPLKGAEGTVVGLSGIARDITRRAEREETIRHQALHDPLTDLPNRKLFMDFLALELAQARRNRKSLAVLFLDLDHFKQINDTLGHAAGDLLLQAVAQRLKGCVRESDTVARIGGDEFNVLMPDLHQTDDVGTVVGKIMGVFEPPFLLDNVEISATTSVGVSLFPDDGGTSSDLVQKADSAMYVAKQKSGNAYQFYNAQINERTVRRQRTERLLRQAVQLNQLELLFQPLVRVDTGKIVGAEALLRWHHPEDGLLLPSQFLGVAEETGAIVPLGEWTIRTACAQMKKWQEKGHHFTVTVNLSNRQFHQPNLLQMTSELLAETGLDPSALELDVTENAIMDDLDSSIRNMRQLSGLGVKFSVDDFGIGSSSLQCIKQLPIDRVKIDRSFIRDILTQSNDLAVVSAVISMSHNLGMKVNAVGVELQEQLTLIRNNGCDEMQGDLISKPLPAEQFEALAANL
jgi:diguanylate cyclase (GGDEF)-like protein/PAS domain S-box-containing protein